MKDNPTPALLLAMFVFAAFFVRVPAEQTLSPQEASTRKVTEGAAKQAVQTPVAERLTPAERLLARHYGLADVASFGGRVLPPTGECPSITGVRDCIKTLAQRDGLQVLIASVPDPVDSQLAAGFDAQLDALTRAAATSGLTLESWTTPWQLNDSSSDSKVPLPDLGRASAMLQIEQSGDAEKDTHADHRLEPGAVLYSAEFPEMKPGEVPTVAPLVLLLLVGEAPTFGVHPGALNKALDLVTELQPQHKVTLVAPTFSGSAPGLKRTLLHWARIHPQDNVRQFDVITGSATAPKVLDQLQRKPNDDEARGHITAHRVIHRDDVLEAAFEHYRADRSEGDARVAYLVERATAYAAGVARLPANGVSGPNAAPKAPPHDANQRETTLSAATADDRREARPAEDDKFTLTYPLHLAQLRAVAARRTQAVARLNTPFARSAIELAMDDRDAVDVLPSFAARQSVNAIELELASTFDSLRRSDMRYIVLTATDSRDQLFLAQQLRNADSKAHLVAFESDVLYSHPSFSQEMLGMLVVSTYPLTAKLPNALQAWRGRRHRQHGTTALKNEDTFPNGTNEGTYYAALIALGQPAPEWSESDGSNPPVWVSAIGRDTTWPVWVTAPKFTVDENTTSSRRPASAPEWAADDLQWAARSVSSMHASTFFRAALLCLALIGIYHGWLYLRWALAPLAGGTQEPSRFQPYPSPFVWLLAAAPPDEPTPESLGRRLARCALLAALLLLLSVPTLIALEPMFVSGKLRVGRDPGRIIELFALFVSGLVLLPAWTDAATHVFVSRRRTRVTYAVLLVTTSAFVVLLFARRHGVGDQDWYFWVNRLLFSLRATHLESGLSPIAPLVLLGAGLLVMFWIEARRAQLLGRFTALYPLKWFTDSGEGGRYTSAFNARRLREQLAWAAPFMQVISPANFRPAFAAAFVLLVIAPAAALLFDLSFALDSVGYRHAFWAGTVALEATLVLAMVRFISVWEELRRLMRAVSASPLCEAFRRVPLQFGRTVGFEPSATPGRILEAQYSLDQLALLRRWSPAREPAREDEFVERLVETIEDTHVELAFRADVEASAATYRRFPVFASNTQVLLAKEVDLILPKLMKFWAGTQQTAKQSSKDNVKDASKDSAKEAESAKDKRPPDAVTRARTGAVAPEDPRFWYVLAEEFVAVQTTTFLSYVYVYLRSALIGMTVGLVVLLLAVTSYPFRPQTAVVNFLMLLIALAVGAGLVAIRRGSRNALLSRLQGTTPDVVTWDAKLAQSLATYVGIPLLAVLAAQMPALSRLASTLYSVIAQR